MESGGPSSTNRELSHQVSLDIDRLIQSVKKELEISYAFSDTCCIYKVLEQLRELNEKAYTPRLVSIGPIHHGKDMLEAMEYHKRMYLQEFLDQTEVNVEAFIEFIKENETRLRDSYAETIGFSSENLIKMILMDATFVIMFLLKWNYEDFRGRRDSIFYPPYKSVHVRLDICLLENQLPFFILEDLYRISKIESPKPTKCFNSPKSTLIELTQWFFSNEWGSPWAVGEFFGENRFLRSETFG